jgi:putative ABC transport system permease protein
MKGQSLSAQMTSVSPDYFQVLGTHLIVGRSFSSSDDHGLHVALINRTMADTLWRGQNALGKRIRIGAADSPQWWVIVGVVDDIKADGLDKPTLPHIYFPIYQQSDYALSVFLKTSTRPEAQSAAMENSVRAVDPDLSVFAIRSMDQVLARVTGTRRFMLFLLAGFASVAVGLALMGVTAVTIFAVSRRTQEIGIRIALGAGRLNVLALILRKGVSLTLWGAGAGVMGALLLTRFLKSFLFGTTPIEPAIFTSAVVLLVVGSVLACYFPARRAAWMDPVAALRKE